MPIRFVCPVCWTVRDGIDDELAGKMVKCHECHAMAEAKHTPEPNSRPAPPPIVGESRSEGITGLLPLEEAGRSAGAFLSPTSRDVLPTSVGHVLLSSGDIPRRYEIVDLVFAHGSSSEEPLKNATPIRALQVISQALAHTAFRLGADAVIHIRLDFRSLGDPEPGGTGRPFEVVGYGTAVKIIP
jgi:hypothetical protein